MEPPALSCVAKRPLLPADALQIVGAFLRRPTPSARVVLGPAPRADSKLDIYRLLLAEALEQRGHGGFGTFVTSKAFTVGFSGPLDEYQFRHKKLQYVLRFCQWCNHPSDRRCPCRA